MYLDIFIDRTTSSDDPIDSATIECMLFNLTSHSYGNDVMSNNDLKTERNTRLVL